MEKKEKKKKIQKKVFFFFLKKLFLKKKKMLLFKKNLVINSFLTGNYVYIYNGNSFRILYLTRFLICLTAGSFVFTKKPFKYLIEKKKKR